MTNITQPALANSLSLKKTISGSWEIANRSKTILWGGIGLIVLIFFFFFFPFTIYQGYYAYQYMTVLHQSGVVDPELLNKNAQLEHLQRIYTGLLFGFCYILFVSSLRTAILLGAGQTSLMSSMFTRLFSGNFITALFVHALEMIIIFFVIGTISGLDRHDPITYLFYLFSFALICLSARLYLVIPALFIRECSLWSACKYSFVHTRNNTFKIIAIKIFALAVFAISVLAVLVGLIWTIPLILILRGYIWQQLSSDG